MNVPFAPLHDRRELVDELRQQVSHCELGSDDAAVFSSGVAGLDRLLPGGGLRHGMLIEWLNEPSLFGRGQGEGALLLDDSPSPPPSPKGRGSVLGGGAATLSLLAAREACRSGGALVVVDRRKTFYPPAAAGWGIDLERLIVVHPANGRDELWAAVQALESPAVSAMWAPIERIDSRAFRRLQLAAQAGRTLGLLMRPEHARGQPSWADVTLGVGAWGLGNGEDERLRMRDEPWQRAKASHPLSLISHLSSYRRVNVRILRCHAGHAGGSAILEIDDANHTVCEVSSNRDTHPLPVVSKLADPAAAARTARA